MRDSNGGAQNYTRWFVNYPSTHRLAGQTVEVTPVAACEHTHAADLEDVVANRAEVERLRTELEQEKRVRGLEQLDMARCEAALERAIDERRFKAVHDWATS